MKDSIGFIGAGNMGSALIKGIKRSNEKILIYERFAEKAMYLVDASTKLADSIDEIVKNCTVVFLCVKPDSMEELLEQIKVMRASTEILFITIAAGKKIEFMKITLKKENLLGNAQYASSYRLWNVNYI
jgi:pyrroline-5-carboxylate reductase